MTVKKLFILTSFALFSTISANSQEAFKHLSLGLELATTGVGLELAFPIVSDHLVLNAGYNYANAKISTNSDMMLDMSELSNDINQYVNRANNYLSTLENESARLTSMPASSRLDGTGNIKFGTFKAVLEYYPSKKSGFHINAGVFIGNENAISLDAQLPDYWNTYKANESTVQDMALKYLQYTNLVGEIPELKASINGSTYAIKDNGNVNASIKISKVRPYFGIGFGRSIPETRFGFQFDMGAIYTGKLGIGSTNEVNGTADINIDNGDIKKLLETAERICIYPQLSFRLVYKLF